MIGMYYLQSRYYDAQVGRFINADDVNLIPTMQVGIKGTNLFEYCNSNSINEEDSMYHLTLSLKYVATMINVVLAVLIIGVIGYYSYKIATGFTYAVRKGRGIKFIIGKWGKLTWKLT